MPRKANKRANGEGTIIPRKGGKWQAVISVRNADGKPIRRAKTARSKADANILLRKMLEERDRGGYVHTANLTVGEYMQRWLQDDVHGEQSVNTYEDYESINKLHITPGLGTVRLKDLSAMKVKSHLADLKRNGLGSRTRLKVYVTLKAALRQAVGIGEILFNPCDNVPRPKYEPEKANPFTVAEMNLLLETCKDQHFGVLLDLAFMTGMRQGEIFGLPWNAVDLDYGEIEVKQQLIEPNGGPEIKEKPKTAAGYRTILIDEELCELLKQHRKLQLKNVGRSALVFLSPAGQYIRKSNFIRNFWKPLLKSCKIEHRGFHHTRHTYATLQISSGMSIPTVARIMGHSNPSVLLKTYAQATKGDQEKAKSNIRKMVE